MLRDVQAAIREAGPGGAPRSLWELNYKAGILGLRYGEESQSLEHFSTAAGLLPKLRGEISRTKALQTIFRYAVAYLRLAETENCCAQANADSCIVPIRGGGLHTRPRGSTEAIRLFRQVIELSTENDPEHDHGIWLLNLASMTLGKYPEEVPERLRISEGAFRSSIEFPRFRNVSAEVGVNSFNLSGGAIFDDFDGDGDFDLLTSTWDTKGQIRYFRNDGGGKMVHRTEGSGLEGIFGGLNLVQADYDNDGHLDALVLRGAWLSDAGQHPNSLLRGHGDGTFTDVTFDAGLADTLYPTQVAAWADYDLDGDLDLFVGNETTPRFSGPCQLFRNEGNGKFVDVAEQAGVQNYRLTKGAAWGDYNGDRYPDLFVSNYLQDNRLFRNRGDGTFEDVTALQGIAKPAASFPVWFWDYDNDGQLDLFVPSYSGRGRELARHYLGKPPLYERASLYRSNGRGGFEDVAEKEGLVFPMLPMGANFGDVDGDGYLDFYLGTGDPEYRTLLPNVLCVYRPGRGFVDVTMAAGVGLLQKGHAVSLCDFDHDGDVDIFEQVGGAYPGDAYHDALFQNPGFDHRWVSLKLVGSESNRSAIGSRVRVVIREGQKRRSIYRWVSSGGSFGANPLEQNIGLGRAEEIELIEVLWPRTGRRTEIRGLELDRRHVIVEGESGGADNAE